MNRPKPAAFLGVNLPWNRQLSRRQLQVFGIIVQRAHQRKRITLRILGEALGIRSTNGVVCHLNTLARRGLITFDKRKANTIRPAYRIELFENFFEATVKGAANLGTIPRWSEGHVRSSELKTNPQALFASGILDL
jgi:SOS-response transcriptional repressor LexA